MKPLSPPSSFDSGVRMARSNGLRMAPQATSGSESTNFLLIVTLIFAASLWSCVAAACTSMVWVELPIASYASARAVLAAVSVYAFSSAGRSLSFSIRIS